MLLKLVMDSRIMHFYITESHWQDAHFGNNFFLLFLVEECGS